VLLYIKVVRYLVPHEIEQGFGLPYGILLPLSQFSGLLLYSLTISVECERRL
jgi:hypothetical protein